MPTGYTAGILDGSIKNFQQFAKQCIRAFGAAMHLRDEPFDKKYTPRKPSDYHLKEKQEAIKKIEKYSKMSNEDIISLRKKQLIESKNYELKAIDKIKTQSNKLSEILTDAQNYKPPTDDHQEIKKFMIEQLESTLKHDGNTTYHDIRLIEIENEIENINPDITRNDLIDDANRDVKYHSEQYDKEVDSCNQSNKWAEQFFDSIKN